MEVLAPQFSYIFLEIATLLTVILIVPGETLRLAFGNRRIICVALLLFGLWTGVDLLAVRLDIWRFPQGGTLPIRFVGLPLEEYILFFLHSVIVIILTAHFRERVRS